MGDAHDQPSVGLGGAAAKGQTGDAGDSDCVPEEEQCRGNRKGEPDSGEETSALAVSEEQIVVHGPGSSLVGSGMLTCSTGAVTASTAAITLPVRSPAVVVAGVSTGRAIAAGGEICTGIGDGTPLSGGATGAVVGDAAGAFVGGAEIGPEAAGGETRSAGVGTAASGVEGAAIRTGCAIRLLGGSGAAVESWRGNTGADGSLVAMCCCSTCA
jgi:hypothetical protein